MLSRALFSVPGGSLEICRSYSNCVFPPGNLTTVYAFSYTFFRPRGKFGVVSKAIHKETSREYAAKFIKCRPREKLFVYGEIEIMNQLNHKRLVQLYDAYETAKNIILVLELVTGGELFEKLTELEFISEHVVVYYMKQVLQGLHYIHDKQILHLDLKVSSLRSYSLKTHYVCRSFLIYLS